MIVEPPDARTVARRAAALSVFTYRMTYERSWSTRTKAQRAEDKEDLEEMGEFSRWAALEEFSSRREADPIRKEVGTWPETEIKQGSWAGENLLMLLWALRRVEPLTPIWKDSLAVHAFLNDEVEGWPEFVDRANLRPAEKIDLMYSYVSCVRLRERTPDTFEGVPWLAEKALSFGGEPPLARACYAPCVQSPRAASMRVQNATTCNPSRTAASLS